MKILALPSCCHFKFHKAGP